MPSQVVVYSPDLLPDGEAQCGCSVKAVLLGTSDPGCLTGDT